MKLGRIFLIFASLVLGLSLAAPNEASARPHGRYGHHHRYGYGYRPYYGYGYAPRYSYGYSPYYSYGYSPSYSYGYYPYGYNTYYYSTPGYWY